MAEEEVSLVEGVAGTAYLVGESRRRRPDLSRDPWAADWIDPALREHVRELWDDFAEAVYRHDDLVVSLRGALVRRVLEEAVERSPDVRLVSVGAGFTSYPWAVPLRSALEVDLPEIVEAKRRRMGALVAAGVLPDRPVVHRPLDLRGSAAVDQLEREIVRLAPDGPVFLVLEGLLYYLSSQRAEELLGLPARLGARCAGTVVSYWPTGAEANPVLERQAAWFRSRGIDDRATHLDVDRVAARIGGRCSTRGPEALQAEAGLSPVLPEEELVPEYLTWMVA